VFLTDEGDLAKCSGSISIKNGNIGSWFVHIALQDEDPIDKMVDLFLALDIEAIEAIETKFDGQADSESRQEFRLRARSAE